MGSENIYTPKPKKFLRPFDSSKVRTFSIRVSWTLTEKSEVAKSEVAKSEVAK